MPCGCRDGSADRGCYHKGERIAQSPMHVWPRDCVRSQTKIVAPRARMEGA